MTPNTAILVWTWVPIVLTGSVFGVKRTIASALLLVDVLACFFFDRALGGEDYGVWSSVGYGCIDYAIGVLLLASGQPILAALFGLSVVNHGVFGYRDTTLAGDPLAQYQSRVTYAWVAFVLTVLPVVVLMRGDGSDSGRRSRQHAPVRPYRRRRLAVLTRARAFDREARG